LAKAKVSFGAIPGRILISPRPENSKLVADIMRPASIPGVEIKEEPNENLTCWNVAIKSADARVVARKLMGLLDKKCKVVLQISSADDVTFDEWIRQIEGGR
jgi:hypothetical protein